MLTEYDVMVIRNDEKSARAILALSPEAIILSPGPGTPREAGICNELVVKACSASLPVFGICLGMQSIAHAFGGKIRHAKNIMHGKVSVIEHDDSAMFAAIPKKFNATRYHSLAVEKKNLPDCLKITAESCDDAEIMALRHKTQPIWGVQFHPESIASEYGLAIIENFITLFGSSKDTKK